MRIERGICGGNKGMTLLEVMIAMGVLSLVTAGLAAAMMQAQRMAYQAIYQNAAFNAAQGFLEQIRSMSYSDLETVYANPDSETLPTMSMSSLSASSVYDDPLAFQASTSTGDLVRDSTGYDEKQVAIDIREGEDEFGSPIDVEITMTVRFTLDLVDLSEGPSGQLPLEAFEVSLAYVYEVPSISGSYWRTGKLVAVLGNHEI